MKPFRIPMCYKLFSLIIPFICIKTHVPLFLIFQSTPNVIIEPRYCDEQYTLAEILSKTFVKKAKENWGPYLQSWFVKITNWCQPKFYYNVCLFCLI